MAQDFSERATFEFEGWQDPHSSWSIGSAIPKPKATYAPRKTLRIVNLPQHSAWLREQDRVNVASEFRKLRLALDRRLGPVGLLRDRLFSAEYAAIVGLGPRVVPLLLKDLQRSVQPWFWALKAITRTDPASDVNPGDFETIAARWIEWGKQKKIL